MDFISEQAESQQLKQVGLTEDEDLFAPVMDSARNRWPWLGLNLLTALVASRVIGAFEAHHPAAGRAGRADADRRQHRRQHRQPDRRAGDPRPGAGADRRQQPVGGGAQGAAIAGVNGLLWGSVVALAALLFYRQPALSLVMGIAVAANLLIASLAGVFIPLR